MNSFTAKIQIIGVNPYVLIPKKVLDEIFLQANKKTSVIPVSGTLNEKKFIQTLVRYAGKWRLYLNTPMRKSTGTSVGDRVTIKLKFDPKPRPVPMHKKLQEALNKDPEALKVFSDLPPSRQKEIMRYISSLKSEVSIERNVTRAIQFLLGKTRFVGLDKP